MNELPEIAAQRQLIKEIPLTARVQNAGIARITATLAALPFWMEWGIGNGGDDVTMNAVTIASTEARSAASATLGTVNVADDTLLLQATISASADVIISELGIFDDAGVGSPPDGGNMIFYCDAIGPISLGEGSGIRFTIMVRFG